MSSWKRDAASGLVVLLPILVSAYILIWIYGKVASVAPAVGDSKPLGVALTLLVFTLLVLSVGYLMRTALGSLVEGAIDNVANQVPVLRVVYNASKMAAETAISGPEGLQKPVKIETWGGVRMTAFKTGKVSDDGRDLLFLPTAPNITTGFVIEVESSDITETGETVEDALTRILSAGFGETGENGISIEVTEEGDGTREEVTTSE